MIDAKKKNKGFTVLAGIISTIIVIALFYLVKIFSTVSSSIKVNNINKTLNSDFKMASAYPENVAETKDYIYYLHDSNDIFLFSKDFTTSYAFRGYPNTYSQYKLRQFSTKDSKYTVYGFSVGDSASKVYRKLLLKGYLGTKKNGTIAVHSGKVNFYIDYQDDTITEINIVLTTYYFPLIEKIIEKNKP